MDQVDWRVSPNQSILFIGPSGIGKDTIINRCADTIQGVQPVSGVPVLGGKTLEAVTELLSRLSKPATAYIPAGEATAFFGRADYQANMLTGITDLLSNGKQVDISTKGMLMANNGAPRIIYEPTVTMHLGSTVDWLHKGMPDGTLEGGFMGRFLIIVEELGGRQIPLVKSAHSAGEIQSAKDSLANWRNGLEALVHQCKGHPREMILFEDAEHAYINWYYNRFKMFSKAVMPYANRSRDMVLRLAMLMALSRGHDRYIEGIDVEFGISMIREVAARIDSVVIPPSPEAQVAMKILEMLPCKRDRIMATLGYKYSIGKLIEPAFDFLVKTNQVETRGGMIFKKGDDLATPRVEVQQWAPKEGV